jgi:DNA-binding GntR family transcriptional regulator
MTVTRSGRTGAHSLQPFPEPIRQRTLHDEVTARVRDMIIEGTLAAGARINESELGPRLGVSRTPLREAIRTLASEGLIELVPRKGAVVRRFSAADVQSMLETVAVLEQAAARLACRRASQGEIDRVVGLHEAMMSRYRSRQRLAYFKLNQAIHTAIVQLAHNPVTAEVHEMLQSRLKRIRYLGNEAPEKWAAAVAEHEQMIAALVARDGDALAEVLGRHMDKTLERVADGL